jgi:hypothetical protein
MKMMLNFSKFPKILSLLVDFKKTLDRYLKYVDLVFANLVV